MAKNKSLTAEDAEDTKNFESFSANSATSRMILQP
jgi:hypothetical protein